jgi:hypothetical protein
MPGLNEEAVRAAVLFAMNRQALRKERGLAFMFGAPEMGGRLEQPLLSNPPRCSRGRRRRASRKNKSSGSVPCSLLADGDAAPRPRHRRSRTNAARSPPPKR